MKSIVYAILTVCFVALSCVGVYFGVSELNQNNTSQTDVTITQVDQVIENLNINLDGLAPGNSISYNINIKCQIPNEKNLTLHFKNAGDKSLCSFVDVKITYNNQIVTGKLDQFLNEDKPIVLNPEKVEIPVTIEYSMSEEIGNEAQNKEAKFDIEIKIVDKEQ